MERKKILWLPSWYPNQNDNFSGDFIQRHARAAAIHQDVHVLFATEGDHPHELHRATGLTEQIIYTGTRFPLGRISKVLSWRKALKSAIKKYFEAHGKPDLVHVHVAWKAGLMALWVLRQFEIPYVVTEHWGFYDLKKENGFYHQSGMVRTQIIGIFQRAVLRTAVSQFLSKLVEQATGETSRILPNVVDTSLFHYQKEKYNQFTFIHVSNMAPVKNAPLIIKAFRDVLKERPERSARLLLIGDKNHCLHSLTDDLSVNELVLMGEVSYTEVAELMRQSHCLVMASSSETFSCVTAEALCCGVPVIASRAGALPELVTESNGIVFDPEQPGALVTAMLGMLDGRQEELKGPEMAHEASKRFGYGAVSEQFRDLYEEALQRMA